MLHLFPSVSALKLTKIQQQQETIYFNDPQAFCGLYWKFLLEPGSPYDWIGRAPKPFSIPTYDQIIIIKSRRNKTTSDNRTIFFRFYVLIRLA